MTGRRLTLVVPSLELGGAEHVVCPNGESLGRVR